MAGRRNRGVDDELDLHGNTTAEMTHLLERMLPAWRGMQNVRLIHGRGDVLRPALFNWCVSMGIPVEEEPNNAGSALIHPAHRRLPKESFKVTLKDKGLALSPQQEAELRDPVAAQRARAEELANRQTAERKKRDDAAAAALKKRQDEAMWQAEVARLNQQDKTSRKQGVKGIKPAAPIVRPPSEMKHQEGWWNAEIVRVADTDEPTLLKQKKVGLEKLAPPVIAQKPKDAEPGIARKKPKRDTTADDALFAAEMERLGSGE